MLLFTCAVDILRNWMYVCSQVVLTEESCCAYTKPEVLQLRGRDLKLPVHT